MSSRKERGGARPGRNSAGGVEGESVQRFPVAPQKIACGSTHTIAIALSVGQNRPHHRDRPVHGKREEPRAYSWGQNHHNALGFPAKDDNKSSGVVQTFENVLSPQKVRIKGPDVDIYEVACGSSHSLFLSQQGDLYAAGLGNCGRLGAPNPASSSSASDDALLVEDSWCMPKKEDDRLLRPRFPWLRQNTHHVLRVACGADHSLAYATDGRLYAWGMNQEGQCGVSGGVSGSDVRTPTELHFPTTTQCRILHFAAGALHSLAVSTPDGLLWVWGCGRNGRLGRGDANPCLAPTAVYATSDVNFAFVDGGEAHSGAVDENGDVYTWGAGSHGRLGHPEAVDVCMPKKITTFTCGAQRSKSRMKCLALGGFHSLFLQSNDGGGVSSAPLAGLLWACGSGASVGLQREGDHSCIGMPQMIHLDQSVVQVAAGTFHSLALLKNGDIVSWGDGANGRLGAGIEEKQKSSYEPSKIEQFRRVGGVDLDPESFFSPAEQDDLRNQPVVTEAGDRGKKPDWYVSQISCGTMHTVALTHMGHLYGWGCNANGQLGIGEATPYCWQPRRIDLQSRTGLNARAVKEVVAGYDFCLAVTQTQELWTWGRGTEGQLGTGFARDELEPQLIQKLFPVTTCAAGEVHSAAVSNNRLYTWGNAEGGVLGLGCEYMSGIRSVPMPVDFSQHGPPQARPKAPAVRHMALTSGPVPTSVAAEEAAIAPIAVDCGQSHTAVILGKPGDPGKTRVWTFGSGWYGKLGLKDQSNAYAPKPVIMRGVSPRSVSCGAHHTCALTHEKDELYIWGRKTMVCEHKDLLEPRRFVHINGGSERIKAVHCGEQHTIAVTRAGDVYAWGENKGQLGKPAADGKIPYPDYIQLFPGPVYVLGTGPSHTVAQFENGEVHAWGNQSCGRLGLLEKHQDRVVEKPRKVAAVWASIDSMSAAKQPAAAGHEGHAEGSKSVEPGRSKGPGEDDGPPAAPAGGPSGKAAAADEKEEGGHVYDVLEKQKVTTFHTMQTLIQQENKDSVDHALQEKEKELEQRFQKILESIHDIREKEKALTNLEGSLEQTLRSNLQYFNKVSPPVVGRSNVNPRLKANLPQYAELVWVLQQQTTYFANLSRLLSVGSDTSSPRDIDVFLRVVENVYLNGPKRNRHLFLMLLRLMIDKEVEAPGKNLDTVFNPDESLAFELMKRYAYNEVHYKDLLHSYFKQPEVRADQREQPPKPLVELVKTTAERSEVFSVSSGTAHNGTLPTTEEDRKNMAKFREFLTNVDKGFLSITKIDLPKDVRQLLRHSFQAVESRHFAIENQAGNQAENKTPEEVAVCEPLLRLFVYGILTPLLTNPTKYTTKEYFLQKSMSTDSLFKGNMKALADVLDKIIKKENFDKQEVPLQAASVTVKQELILYLKRQVQVSDDLATSILTDTFLMHFDRSVHPVALMTSDLQKLSNMLKEFIHKLRISQCDKVEALVKRIPRWTDEEIAATERGAGADVLHNLVWEPRFLLSIDDFDEISTCSNTNCLLPRSLCGNTTGKRKFFRTYAVEASKESHQKVLETLFRDLPSIQATNFTEMRDAFDARRMEYEKKAVHEGSTANFGMVKKLNEGIRLLDELINYAAHTEDVLKFMSDSLVSRDRHRQYLGQIAQSVKLIDQVKERYMEDLKKVISEMEQARKFSLSLDLPEKFKKDGKATRFAFYFADVNKKMELKRDGLKPWEMMGDLRCSYSPIATYSLHKLRATDVIIEVDSRFESMLKNMHVTVQAMPSGGVDLTVALEGNDGSQTSLKTLCISKEKLDEVKCAGKDEAVALANPGEKMFLKCNSTNFTALITKLRGDIA